jgi:hypothetical protein
MLIHIPIFFEVLGFELASQGLYHLSHIPGPFSLGYFSDRVSCFLPGAGLGPQSSYLCFLCNWDYTTMPGSFVEMGSC